MGAKSIAETNAAESGFQGSDGNTASNLSGLDVYKSIGTTIDLSPTDHGSVNRAFALVDSANVRALDYADEQIDRNYTFTAGVTERVLDVADGALVFADDQLDRNYDFTVAIGNAALNEVERNRQFAADVIAQNSAAAAAASDSAFRFAGEATTKALDTITGSTTQVFDQIGEGYSAALDGLQSSTQSSYDFIESNQARTFSLYNKVVDEANNLLNGLTLFTRDIIEDQSAGNTATVAALSDATRSEASQSLDKLIKYAAGAFAVVAIGSVLARRYA